MNPCMPLSEPPRLLTPEQRKAAHDLIGTAHMAHPEWFADLTIPQLREIDNIVFSCGDCGWWCAAEECNETGSDWVCTECMRDREAEEADR